MELKERLQRESAAAQDQLADAHRDAERELALLNERLDEESRARSAALSARKEVEAQLAERQALLDSEVRQRAEQTKQRKRFEAQARYLQAELDKERYGSREGGGGEMLCVPVMAHARGAARAPTWDGGMDRSRAKRLEDLLKQAEGKLAGLTEQLQASNADVDRLNRARKALEADLETAKDRDTFNETTRNHLLSVRRAQGASQRCTRA